MLKITKYSIFPIALSQKAYNIHTYMNMFFIILICFVSFISLNLFWTYSKQLQKWVIPSANI